MSSSLALPKLQAPVSLPANAWEKMASQFSAPRREKMERVAANRTNYLRLVIQDIHHQHNVSACLRSADAFGVTQVDVVTLHENFKPSTAAKGVEDWLVVQRFRQIDLCANALHEQGFALAAGFPDADAVPLEELPLDRPIAVVFGNEHDGVDQGWNSHIDYRFTIPMFGMVESLNISVSCAVTLQSLRSRLFRQFGLQHCLPPSEQIALLDLWASRQRSHPDQLKSGDK